MDALGEAVIEKAESNIGAHCFTTTVAERVIKFEVLKLKDSIYLWIGEKHRRHFSDFSLALNSRCSSEPICTKIMGQPTDLASTNLACKLSKKLGKPVYVSFNLTEDRLTMPVINKRIADEIQKHPQFF